MLSEFKSFLLRGNVIDLAIGLIAGSVFGAVVKSLVEDLIMPLITAIVGKQDYTSLSFTVNDSVIKYGSFITVTITFLLTMTAVFFFIVKPVNVMSERLAKDNGEANPTEKKCQYCLSDIPAEASRCRYCTSELKVLS